MKVKNKDKKNNSYPEKIYMIWDKRRVKYHSRYGERTPSLFKSLNHAKLAMHGWPNGSYEIHSFMLVPLTESY